MREIPPAPPGGPRSTESTFRTFDGTELFYRAWLTGEPARLALILLHRGHEHSGRYEDFVAQLDLPADTAIFAHDARGHGRSPGERGYAPTFGTLVKDVDTFARFISETHGIALDDMAVLGHSVGAVVAAAWVHDYAPPLRALVLATPALKVRLYVPFAMPALRARNVLSRKAAFIKSYVRPGMLTRDANEARRYAEDPLISRQIAVNVLIDLRDTADRLLADAGAIRVPTLIQTAGSDWVVDNRAAERFLDRLGSSTKSVRHYDGFGHSIFHELERDRPIADVGAFLLRAFDGPLGKNRDRSYLSPSNSAVKRGAENRDGSYLSSLLDADCVGYTRNEYERLSKPLAIASPRRAMFAAQVLGMKTGGRLSRGIDLGWRTGFDSGESLDHVYRDRAAGITPLGRLIDRCYLDAIGWRGIRQRKVHLMRLLSRAIEMTAERGEPVRIVDIASGPGRYLLETLKERAGQDIHATLRDCSEPGLQAGRALARELGVTNVAFEHGDAFDRASLAQIAPRPNIGIVSGLYELFPNNSPVRASLAGLAQAIAPGGYLLYTNQPWHPQVEMIARCLVNRDGKPWVMRRRTQAEMDALVRAAGFEKVTQEIDRWGIFTVSLARRV
jgi:alpha-beta hydrolase superfamily lysophospholipase/SAM-dependent methyltransferase